MTVAADETLAALNWTVQTVKTTAVKRYKGRSIRGWCDQPTLCGTSRKRQGSRKLGDTRLGASQYWEAGGVDINIQARLVIQKATAKSGRLHYKMRIRSCLKETAKLISILENSLRLAESLRQTANHGSSGPNSSSQSLSRMFDHLLCCIHHRRIL